MKFIRSVVLALLFAGPLFIPRAGAQLSIAIVFSSDPSGISLNGLGIASAGLALGSVRAYGGSVPSGVTKTVNGSSNWTLTTPFDITVVGLGIVVPSFTLTAKLQSADAVNTWKIGSVTLNSGSASTLTTTGTYNVATAYSFGLTIPFTEAAGSISNTINFAATGN